MIFWLFIVRLVSWLMVNLFCDSVVIEKGDVNWVGVLLVKLNIICCVVFDLLVKNVNWFVYILLVGFVFWNIFCELNVIIL